MSARLLPTPVSTSFSAAARGRRRSILAAGVAVLLGISAGQQTHAVNATWNGTTDGTWATGTNWSATPVPGAGNTATFSNAGNGNTTISLSGITIRTILFDTASAAAYTLGSGGVDAQAFTLENSGAVTANANVANAQTFNATTNLGTATAGTYTITNNSGSALTFAGVVQGGSGGTGAAKTLNVGGSGQSSFSRVTRGGATALTLAKTGAGTTTLGGTLDYTGVGFTLGGGTLILNVASTSSVHAIASNSTLTSGTLQLSGTGGDQISDSAMLTVNGGIFDLNGKNETVGALAAAAAGGIVRNNLDGTTSTLTVGGANSSGSFAGVIANNAGGGATGLVGLAKTGTGTQTLGGANSYSGGTVVSGGILSITSTGNLGTNVVGNDVVVNAGGNVAIAAAANIGANQTLTIHSNATALGGVGVGFDGLPTFTNTRTGTTTGGILGINTATFATALDMATLGGGGMFLGSQFSGTYAATTLGAEGTTYRLGGGGGVLTLSEAVLTGTGHNVVIGDTRTNGRGTIILAANNTYTGTTTIASGSILQLGTGGTTGTIANISGITNNGTLAFNRSDVFVLNSAFSGSGTVSVLQGTFRLGGASLLPATSALSIGGPGTAGHFDTDTFDQTVSSLSVTSNTATASTVTIGAGRTLTVNGSSTSFSVGVVPAADGQTTSATFSGGSLAITNTAATVEIGRSNTSENNAANTTTVDMSALASFSANVTTFRVGFGPRNGVNYKLSDTSNTIIATNFVVADTNNFNGATTTLTLGAGTNLIRADSIVFVAGKGNGDNLFSFASTTPGSAGTLTITNKAGTGGANITISNKDQATAANPAGIMDLRGHVVDVTANTVIIGQDIVTGTNGSSETGTLKFDTGTFTATSLQLGNKTSSSTNTASGLLEVGGTGSFTVNSSGLFRLGNRSGSAGNANGTVTITGGTLTTHVNITTGGQTGTTSTLTLDGGTLDLQNHAIGGTGALITNLNFRSGTLQNVTQINDGAGLTKTAGSGSNTLTLAGTNGYTGATNVNSGTLLVSGAITGSTAVNVNNGATLGGSGGTIGTNTTTVTVNAGGTLAPGSSIGALNVGTASGNNVVFSGASGNNAVLRIELDAGSSSSDLLAINGNLNLSSGFDQLTLILLNGSSATGSYTIATYTGTLTGTFDSVVGVPAGYALNYGTGTNSTITLAIPEPGAFPSLLGGLGLLAGLQRFRRRAA